MGWCCDTPARFCHPLTSLVLGPRDHHVQGSVTTPVLRKQSRCPMARSLGSIGLAPPCAPIAPCKTELWWAPSHLTPRTFAMASRRSPVDRALETAYVISHRAHFRATGVELWAGPHQLIVVVPPDGQHFHQPYCPRAGSMDHVHYIPLPRALRLRLSGCRLRWPLHRGEVSPGAPRYGIFADSLAGSGSTIGVPRTARLTVRLTRLPIPRVRLHALRPFDYVAEWQILTAFLHAALPRFCHDGLFFTPHTTSLHAGPVRINWPELLQAARRLLQIASLSEAAGAHGARVGVLTRRGGPNASGRPLSRSLPPWVSTRPSTGAHWSLPLFESIDLAGETRL
jgi:hypothetical protein